MQTYLGEGIESSSAIGFEIDNIYVSLGKIVNILEGIHDVTVVKKESYSLNGRVFIFGSII